MTTLQVTNTRYTRYGKIRDKFVEALMNEKHSTITTKRLYSMVYKAGGSERTAENYQWLLKRNGLIKSVGYAIWELPKNRTDLKRFNTSNI